MCRAYGAAQTEIEHAYREYYAPLLRFVSRQAHQYGYADSQVDREGVVQHAFELAIRYWDQVHDPRAWLFTVADRQVNRQAFQWGRRYGHAIHRESVEFEEARWSSFTSQADTGQILSAAGAFEVMADLPERQRVATYLHHVHGLTQAEIAGLLGCKPSTVGVHIHRGVEKIRNDPRVHVTSPRQQSEADGAVVIAPEVPQPESVLTLAGVGLSGVLLGGVLYRWKPPVWAAALTVATAAVAAPPSWRVASRVWRRRRSRRDENGGPGRIDVVATSVPPGPAMTRDEPELTERFEPTAELLPPEALKPSTPIEMSSVQQEPEPDLEPEPDPEPEPPARCAVCGGSWWRTPEEIGCWCGRYVPDSGPDPDAEEVQQD